MRHFFYTLLCCTIAMSLTACLGDDDNEDTSLELQVQTKQLVADMQGVYSGRLTTTNKDTLYDVKWKVDTVLHALDVPDTLFAKCILDRESNLQLIEALSKDTKTDILAPLVYAQQKSDDGQIRAFYLYPYTLSKTLSYGGSNHTVNFVFANYPYSYGFYNYNRATTFQLVLLYLYVDDKPMTDVYQTAFIFTNSYTKAEDNE